MNNKTIFFKTALLIFIMGFLVMYWGCRISYADSMLTTGLQPLTGEGETPETIEELSVSTNNIKLTSAGALYADSRIWGPALKAVKGVTSVKTASVPKSPVVKKYPAIQVRYKTYIGKKNPGKYERLLSSRGGKRIVLVNITPVIIEEAAKNKISPLLLKAIIQTESGYDNYAVGGSALGLCQMMPQTARSMGVRDPFNPYQNIAGGARYLGMLMRRYRGNMDLAIAAYNLGPGGVGSYVPSYAWPFVRMVKKRMRW